MRRVVRSLLAVLLVVTALDVAAILSPGGDAWAAPPDHRSAEPEASGAGIDAPDRWVVEFEAEADLAGAARIESKRARGTFVRDRLVTTARRSQAEAIRVVEGTEDADATSYWLRNVLVVEGDADLLAALADLDGVSDVRPERTYPLIEPVPLEEAVEIAVADPAWGVERIGATSAWARGVTGGGIVVANIDTGVDVTHPALVGQYRGNLGAAGFVHDHNWWDPTGICGREPCDNAGHGTHTMGTMVGGDGPGPFSPDIGVAPGARWIAAKGCEDFGCSESALLSSGQFVLAPTDLDGGAPDPGRAPHIVNNSWGGGPGDEMFLETVRAWRAAGIIPVFSSGNPGPECGGSGSPSDYLESLGVGATDRDDVIAEFSGRGPSGFGKINPDVTAPGVEVVSSVPGGGYDAWNGTSMAAPHVAGTLALMLSAEPDLVGDVDGAIDALTETAVGIEDRSCGGADEGIPNNVYGHGRIDAAAAVDLIASGGTLAGTITAADTGQPIGGARITATGPERTSSTFTRTDGTYRLLLRPGRYAVNASAFGHEAGLAVDVEIVTDQTTVVDLALTPLPRFVVGGRVTGAEDGAAIAGATVRAVGTPLDPVTTDRQGRYRIELPVGLHLLEVSKGGCLQRATIEVEVLAEIQLDLPIARKLDRFGHGCELVRYAPARTRSEASLYGDDSYGRLRLPFAFSFYGERYEAVYLDTNGYLAFVDPDWSHSYNTPIPNVELPNAAVYALWQDLVVDGGTDVTYSMSGNAAVIDLRGLRVFGGDARMDLQVQLRRDGTIEVHYGDGAEAVGGGARATVGLEDHTGTDAFQYAFREQHLTDRMAVRYRRVATSTIQGTVTDANDGLPIQGATVTASPGGQTARTDADGRYALRVLAGSYTVEPASDAYVSVAEPVSVRADRTITVDFSLRAARAEVTPSELAASTPQGSPTEATVTVANTGSAPLTFSLRERDLGSTPPDLPPVVPTSRLVRPPEWRRPDVPEGVIPPIVGEVDVDEELEPIIEDPAGDALGPVDLVTVRAAMDEHEVALGFDFTPDTPMEQLIAFAYLDVDRDPSTGLPPEALAGKPTQDIGVDYFVNVEAPSGEAWVVSTETFEVVAVVPVAVAGRSLRFDVPLEVLTLGEGHDIVGMDVVTIAGDWEQLSDWAPDVGHGTVEPYRDATWMAAEPTVGEVAPGEATEVTVTLGGEDVAVGDHVGQLVFQTNAPRQRRHRVEVTLSVTLAEDAGAVGGTVTDAFTESPVPGAVVELIADLDPPFRTTVVTDADGAFLLYAPAGTWPVTVTAEGYLAASTEATVVAGKRATLDVVLDPEAPRAVLEGGPLEFVLEAGADDQATLTLRNEGNADLTFEIRERSLSSAPEPSASAPEPGRAGPARGATSRDLADAGDRAAVEPRLAGAAILVLMDALPWESTALLDVLEANGLTPDVAGSSVMGELDLDPYDVIVLANDQPPAFYEAYREHAARLERFVTDGGLLWVGAATFGANGGGFEGAALPGGMTVLEQHYEEYNDVVDREHPLMVGVPETFAGSVASHSAFGDLPTGTGVIAVGQESRLPTMVEYDLGAGRVLASGQTLEWAFDHGEDGAPILVNLAPYLGAWTRASEVPWLTVDPTAGTVAPGQEQTITVTVEATDLGPGSYGAQVVVDTDDPALPRILVPVALQVIG
jgi:subtilisin family serine protease